MRAFQWIFMGNRPLWIANLSDINYIADLADLNSRIRTDMDINKWPKLLPPLTEAQQKINDEFVQKWHEALAGKRGYRLIEKFNHGYVVSNCPASFVHTLEIGAGLGEHLNYEKLTKVQQENYVALEIRANMLAELKKRHPSIKTYLGDCQETLPFQDGHFERVLAIHVLEHLPNLPATIRELYRVCNKKNGCLSVVIPCEGGYLYSLARKVSAQRLFEKAYHQSYNWFIEREHLNKPNEIMMELKKYFQIKHKTFFPFKVPSVHLNLCIGLTLAPIQL